MRGKTLSVEARSAIGDFHRGRPKSTDHKEKISAAQTGKLNHNWSGGQIVRDGRVLILVGSNHPMSDSYGYVYRHRLVIAEAMDRILSHDDCVHHIDLDPSNDQVDNLVVLTLSEHTRVHNAIRNHGIHHLEALRMAVCP